MVITLEEAKVFMNMDADYDMEDGLISDMIVASVSWCESYTGLSFSEKNLTAYAKNKRTELVYPVISITSVKDTDFNDIEYMDVDGVVFTRGCEALISYKSGYTAETLPAPLKTAVKMMVATLHENREDFVTLRTSQTIAATPLGIKDLLQPYSRSGGLFI